MTLKVSQGFLVRLNRGNVTVVHGPWYFDIGSVTTIIFGRQLYLAAGHFTAGSVSGKILQRARIEILIPILFSPQIQ